MDFRGAHGTEAAGRTSSPHEAAEAVALWLDCERIEDLHEQFAFVDRRKRAMSVVEAGVIARHPELGRIARHSPHQFTLGDHVLMFKTSDRSCRLGFHGREESPDVFFQWDDCVMCRTRIGDVPRVSAMLKRWLRDMAMPSEMAAEFPELEVEPVARYYEQGRPVEGEFLLSWDWIERYYQSSDWPPRHRCEPILALIAEIREAGFDRLLRAGQSLLSLCVSRSRRLASGKISLASPSISTSIVTR